MIEIIFNNESFNVMKRNWEDWLGIEWRSGTLLNYDERMGRGVIFLLELENGLTVSMSDYTTKDDVVFINKAYTSDKNFLFTLNYLVIGDVYIVKDKNKRNEKQHMILNKMVLHHSKSDFSFIAHKGKRARVIDLIFTHEWLLNQFEPTMRSAMSAKILEIEKAQSFYITRLSAKSFEFAKEILDRTFYDDWDNIFLKSRVAFLIEEFVKNYILPKNNQAEQVKNDELLLTMMEIKKRINESLYDKMPKRKTLSKEFLMSESTLDRRFKHYFGKTINDYYLEEKMELAHRILNRDGYSIAQIAYLLGYETVSAFIKTFKKYFGEAPGSLRRSSII